MTSSHIWRVPRGDVERLLAEDVPAGDLTTDSLGLGARPGLIEFRARDAMAVAGVEIAEDMMRACGLTVARAASSGDRLGMGALLLSATGDAAAIHSVWKVSQTLVEIMSGVATAARAIVDVVDALDPSIRVACTRKTFPGGRRLSQIAVRAGGAILHRLGLSETLLVFPEHRVFMPGETFGAIATRLRHAAPEKKIVIEVASVADAIAAVDAGFDVIQLEKMQPSDVAIVAAAASSRAKPPLVAAAGGIGPHNAEVYVKAGAGLLVTSWPYTARPADVQVAIGPA